MRRVALALIALAGAHAGDAQPVARPGSRAPLPAPVELDREGRFQDKFVRVGDDMFIGGQPTERALRELKAQGVTMVVNLRTPPEMQRIGFDEAALLKELGMKYVYLPMRGDSVFPYSPATLKSFADAMKGADGKVLLHCTVAWRASHLWGAYLIQERGVSEADALTHTRAINLMDDHRMGPGDRQPIEQFLGRPVTGLGRRQ